LPETIQVKLAAGGYYDLAEVVSLIRVLELDVSFTAQLHPWTHADFIECLEEKRREDEYQRREDAAG
jgi:hypothetical protein